MLVADLPPYTQDMIICSISASIAYEIPTDIMLAVAEKEGGRPHQIVENTNGTVDIGSMQFNTVYAKELESKYNIKPDDLAKSGCYPFYVASWRIKNHIVHDQGDIWQRVANYHSRTEHYNKIYREDLKKKAYKWAIWLKINFDIMIKQI